MVSGTRDNPSQRQVYRAFIYENVNSVGRVKVNPAWLFITLIEKSNVQIFLFLWVSFGHPITVCFAELIFTSLIRISASNPKSRHYVTLAKARAVPGRRVKAFIWRKSCPTCQGYPACRSETTRPPELSRPPRRKRLVEVWKETSWTLPRPGPGNSGGGLSRVPETI